MSDNVTHFITSLDEFEQKFGKPRSPKGWRKGRRVRAKTAAENRRNTLKDIAVKNAIRDILWHTLAEPGNGLKLLNARLNYYGRGRHAVAYVINGDPRPRIAIVVKRNDRQSATLIRQQIREFKAILPKKRPSPKDFAAKLQMRSWNSHLRELRRDLKATEDDYRVNAVALWLPLNRLEEDFGFTFELHLIMNGESVVSEPYVPTGL